MRLLTLQAPVLPEYTQIMLEDWKLLPQALLQ
jgi:hypothetical protein